MNHQLSKLDFIFFFVIALCRYSSRILTTSTLEWILNRGCWRRLCEPQYNAEPTSIDVLFPSLLVYSTLQHETGVTMSKKYKQSAYSHVFAFFCFSMRRAAVCSFHTHAPYWSNGSPRPAFCAAFRLSHPAPTKGSPTFTFISACTCEALSAVNNNDLEAAAHTPFSLNRIRDGPLHCARPLNFIEVKSFSE